MFPAGFVDAFIPHVVYFMIYDMGTVEEFLGFNPSLKHFVKNEKWKNCLKKRIEERQVNFQIVILKQKLKLIVN